MTEAVVSDPEAPGEGRDDTAQIEPTGGEPWFRKLRPHHALYLLALVPPATMLQRVLSTSRLQWYDYWDLLPRFINPDGSLALRNLLDQHEGHILGIPRLVYWLNVHLFAGSNVPLGVYVCAVAAAQLVLLAYALPRRLSPWWRAGLTVAISVMLFAPQGVHNFTRAMSGTAWLTANLLVIVSILAATRGRAATAAVFAVLASITYGTGLAAWPVIVVILVITKRADIRRLATVCVTGTAVVLFYAINYEGAQGGSKPSLEPSDVLRRTMQVLGSLLSQDPDTAVLYGIIGVTGFAALAWVVVRTDQHDGGNGHVVFIGLGMYGIGTALLIGGAHGGIFGDDIGVTSRYASLSAMLWISVVVLVALVRPRVSSLAGICIVVMLCFVGGRSALADAKGIAVIQDELAIAMRMDVGQGWPYDSDGTPIRLLEDLGHYPFNDSFDDDCGLIGTTISETDVYTDDEDSGRLDEFSDSFNDRSLRMKGWFDSRVGRRPLHRADGRRRHRRGRSRIRQGAARRRKE